MAKIKKAQGGKNVPKGMVESEMYPGKMIPKSKSNYESGKMAKSIAKPKAVVAKKKMKDGGKSFPDLTGDGKVTKADILKGRGVIKNGGKMKKAKSGASLSPSNKSVSSELGGYKKVIGKNYAGKAKSGASVVKKMMGGGKCKYGC